MCSRFVTNIPPEVLAAIFGLREVPQLEARFNVAPTQQVAVVRSEGDHNRLDLLKWGFVPGWSKDLSFGSHLINARSETVAEKPAFRHAIKYRRCIVPTSGFYEWSHSGDKKQPYYIQLADHSPMCLAGVWEAWKAPDNSVLESFAILTTAANSLVEPLHDRMPVILHPDDYSLWLNHNMHDPQQLQPLFRPFPVAEMIAHQVPDLVNNPRFDSPACIRQV
ncbi:MAG: SOS response-associated peptidase [Deltaproteobacteria bacterium]|nr:SOS response-associated peptidase [Deltaproteobacteria bacterium]